ncbi:dynein beta chain, ciliary-like [Seriola lalandi dorsalis]|uniref:dynein beta chain, ciliary-like n=1 Tax=Seriola lalandi dorsalis TaxID=1841481 RepID=UPI000C6F66C6|nr:dynein beta chain, ciliary-like [Seriola lalandi dorsalis]
MFHASVSEARANMDAMTHIIQGWVELHLLQRSGESLLESGATRSSYGRMRDEGQELLRLTQVNRSLYGAAESSECWIRYLDHIDDKVQDGLFQLLLRSLHFLSDNTDPQSCHAALLAVSLQLQETGSVFEPSVGGGLSDLLTTIISDIYTAASLPPRISVGRHDNYQVFLQQSLELSALEQEVMQHLLQVREEAERLKTGLDKYSHLWHSDRQVVIQEFLTYSRQLGPEELEAEETPPTLKDFQREIDLLHRVSREVTHLDEVIVLNGWLQVDLQPFRDSLLSIIHDWRNMYTDYLLDSVSDR